MSNDALTTPAPILEGTHSLCAEAQEKTGLDRRGFLIRLAGGLSIGFFLPGGNRILGQQVAADAQLNAFIRIGTDGVITLSFGGCEMGQGSRTGLSMILAEELKVGWNQVRVEQAVANPAISYITGGSSAVARNFMPLRLAGATARELLVAAAMLSTGDRIRANYVPGNATVTYTNPTTLAKRTWRYSDLAVDAASSSATALLPDPIPLTPTANFKLIGTRAPRVDIPTKVNGSAQFGLDVWLPNMVFAVIKHCPTLGGTLANTPATPSGAIAVVPCRASDNRGAVTANTYNAVAVVADNTWKARNLARQLRVSWTLPTSTAGVDSTALQNQAQQLLTSGTPLVAESSPPAASSTVGAQIVNALKSAAAIAQGTFNLPYLAHATMEVLNCSVDIAFSGSTPVRCEIWAPNQAALWVEQTVIGLTGLAAAQIIVHTTLLGGGLGRKIEQDYVSQAIQVALVVKRPVKLMWFREEDFSHDNYRPMAVVQATAGLDSTGKIAAWSYRNVSPSILGQRGWIPAGAVDSQAIEGAIKLPYNRGIYLTEWVPLPAGIPVGFWRSVGNSINSFVVESLIDMLAKAANKDPFIFRYGILTDDRARAVLSAADQLSAWRKSLPAGHAWGLALVQSFGTMVCEVMEISQPSTTSVRVHRVLCVVDCGQVINPDSVEAQMQGGIIHGLNAALWGQTTFVNGVAQQTNFNKYRMMRMGEAPDITVSIQPSANPPSGCGEPAVPPAAPALLNAYAALTGKRQTSLPLFPNASMGGL